LETEKYLRKQKQKYNMGPHPLRALKRWRENRKTRAGMVSTGIKTMDKLKKIIEKDVKLKHKIEDEIVLLRMKGAGGTLTDKEVAEQVKPLELTMGEINARLEKNGTELREIDRALAGLHKK